MESKKINLALFLLRVALATVFLYAAIASFLEPDSWIGYFPDWMREVIPAKILLAGFSIYELALALVLLSAKFTKYAAWLAALTLAAIVIQNYSQLDVIFRDLGLLFAALALAALSD